MKRSVLIKESAAILKKAQDEGKTIKEAAAMVLAHHEKRGMKPPYSKSTAHYCECGCKGRCELGNQWEEE